MPEMSEDRRLLAVTGLSELAERVYLFVVHHGRTLPDDVVERFDVTADEAVERLEELRVLGLVSRASDTERYAAVDPRVALGAATERAAAQVQLVRERIPLLADEYERSFAGSSGAHRSQIISDVGEVAGWFVRLQHLAKHELLVFDRPPYASVSQEPLTGEVIERGVTWRAVYSADSFDDPEDWEAAQRLAERGEQGRVVAEVPVKLVIADRTTAMVSLSVDGLSFEALVTDAAPLVQLLCLTFETYWERGLPLSVAATDGVPTTDGETSATVAARPTRASRAATSDEQALLALIGAGLTDEVIAARLGLSVRTLRRRSQRLMAELGAANRFQAGVEAARRGWV